MWDLAQRKRLALWPHPGNDPQFGSGWQNGPLVFSPDGRRIASGCYGASGIEIWDTATGKRLHELHPPQRPPYPPPSRSNIFARIFKGILGRSSPLPVTLFWDSFSERMVTAIVFTPDNRLVISCGENRAVIREVESGRELAQCRAATNILCLALSPDGRTLATGDQDHSIRLWEIPSGRELVRWPAHDGAITALTFSPDGTTLASGSSDNTMKLWNLPFLRRELAKLALDW